MNDHRFVPEAQMQSLTVQEQLDQWVDGASIHRNVSHLIGGECCPDFSCCKPHLLAPRAIRVAFRSADQKTRTQFLSHFLVALIEKLPVKVVIIDGTEYQ